MTDLIYDSPNGIVAIPAADQARAEKAGWKALSKADADALYASRQEEDQKQGPGGAAQAAGEGFVKGAVGTFSAPARAAVGLADVAGAPRNKWTDSLANLPENALGALGEVFGGQGGGERAIAGARERKVAHPLAEGAGQLAGAVAGFAPVSAVGNAAASVAAPLAGSQTAGIVAAGAAEGATLTLADATEQARAQDSALTFQHALASVGLGALFGGTLNFAGKKAGEFLGRASRAEAVAAEAPSDMFPLDVPEPRPHPRTSDRIGAMMPDEIPGLDTPAGPATVRAPPLPRESELAAEWENKLGPRDNGVRMPSPGGGPERPTVPAPPMTNADVGMNFPGEGRMAQRARYAPDAVEGDELGMGGLPGGPDVEEDLARAGRGEALHMQRRAAKVERLLAVVPEGASPDWILKMAPEFRASMADMVGVPEASDSTWKALADAVSQREGIALSEPMVEVMEGRAPDLEGQLRASLAEKVGAPPAGTMLPPPPAAAVEAPAAPINAPAPGNYQGPTLGAVPAEGYAPPQPINAPAPGSFQGPTPGPTSAGPDVIGVPLGSTPIEGDSKAAGLWSKLMSKLAKHGAQRFAGKLVGGAIGGTHGPLGVVVGMAAGEAVDRMLATSAAQRMASRGARAVESSINGALSGKGGAARTSPFMKGAASPEAAFKARAAELEALAANPQGLIDKVGKAFGPIEDAGAIQAVLETAQRGIQYLVSKMPTHGPDPNSLTPHAEERMPDRSAISEFALIHDTVMHPETAMADMKNGMMVPQQADALRAVYPPLADKAAKHVLNQLVSRKDPLWRPERQIAAMLLGAKAGIDSPEFATKYGEGFYNYGTPSQEKGAKGGAGRQLRHKSTAASAYGTTTTQLLAP